MNAKQFCLALFVAALNPGILPARADDAAAVVPTTNMLVIHADQGKNTISRNLYGQFSEHLGRCVYEGIWVGEDSPIPNTRGIRNDVVAALKKIQVPVLRWPGGCFADQYHWMDGVGPRDQRPKRINTTWGGVVEDNHFGTHEFLDFCDQIGAAPYLSGNVGSGTVEELAEWIEYLTAATNSVMSDLRRKNGRDRAVENPVRRHRQRKLGLRRQHDAGILRGQFPPLQRVREKLSGQQNLSHRIRREQLGHQLDRGADEKGRRRR